MPNLPKTSKNEGDSSTNEGATVPTVVPPPAVPTGSLPVPLPLEPLAYEETSEEAQEQGQGQPQPAVVDMFPPQVEEQLPADLPPDHIIGPVHDGTKATMYRSNCTRCPSRCLRDSIKSHVVQVYESAFMEDDDLVTNEHPLSALAALNDPDILDLHQAMEAPDAAEFQKSMAQEFNAHCDKKHWAFVLRSSLPSSTKVLPAIWAMCCK